MRFGSLAYDRIPRFGGGSLSAHLAAKYSDAVAVDFRDGSMVVKDTVTPANNYSGRWVNKIALARSSTAWYLDDDGNLRSVASGVPRISSTRGMLIERQATNTITDNSALTGAVVGTVGSGGAYPSNWQGFSSVTGLTREIVAVGTLANGMKYIDLRISGTNTSGSTGYPDVAFRAHTGNAAAFGETWTASVYAQIVAGSRSGFVNSGTRLQVAGRNSGGTYLEGGGGSAVADASMATFQRLVATYTMANASTANANCFVDLAVPAGNTVDITYRFALPQLEKDTIASSPILTTSGNVTRYVDAIAHLPSTAFNLSQTAGTLYASGVTTLKDTSVSQTWAALSDGTSANRVFVRRANGSGYFSAAVIKSGVGEGFPAERAMNDNASFKAALAWAANDVAAVLDGGAVNTDLTLTMPTSLNRLEFGAAVGGSQPSGWVKQILHVPQDLSDSAIQALTA